MAGSMKDIERNVSSAIDDDGTSGGFRPLRRGEIPGGGSAEAAAAAAARGSTSHNQLRGRDNEDDGDGSDENAGFSKGQIIGGGNQQSADIHANDAANRTGIFDPKYDHLPGINQQRVNALSGRDNDDDGDGSDR